MKLSCVWTVDVMLSIEQYNNDHEEKECFNLFTAVSCLHVPCFNSKLACSRCCTCPGLLPDIAMAFVKVLKNAAYFKRFQVAKRRRREGKTDYHARRKMVRQDKNKFNNRKYRLVVRFTNKRCICQCCYATLRGDVVVAAASSHELTNFGIPAGHKNYAAAYATGLLLARRVLKKFGLDEKFKGKEEIDGEEYHIEDEDTEQKPFKCILDVGIRRTCVGHRMWGALKGAVDGGLHVPHKAKNFPGYKAADEKGGESEYDAEAHKEKIFGNHATWPEFHAGRTARTA